MAKKPVRAVKQWVSRRRLLELYEMINNKGIECNQKKFLDYFRRKTDDEEMFLMFQQILTLLVDIINENATIKIDLVTQLMPIKVSARDIYDKTYGGQTDE